jgi:hypothetical protein
MEDKNLSSAGKGVSSIVLWAFLCLVVYFLSVGPAAWIHKRTKSAAVQDALKTIYTPIILLAEQPPFGRAVEWYIGIWTELAVAK